MIVRTIEEITNTERHVKGVGFESLRLILASDNMGFSLHKTIIPKGDEQHWHYKDHLEACFCISGYGILTSLDTGHVYNILPDTIYILDKHDNHKFEADEDTVLISVFNPPVSGNEIHREDGSYELPHYLNRDKAEEIVNAVYSTQNKYDAIESVQNILNLKTNKNER